MGRISIFALVLVAGCAKPGVELVGSWTPTVVTDGTTQRLSGTTLDLKTDGKFVQVGFPVLEGTWRVERTELVLLPTMIAGMSPSQVGGSAAPGKGVFAPKRLKISDGGNALEQPPSSDGRRTIWRREPSN